MIICIIYIFFLLLRAVCQPCCEYGLFSTRYILLWLFLLLSQLLHLAVSELLIAVHFLTSYFDLN